jgi:hypothetical protein
MMITAIEMQLSTRETQDSTQLESDILALLNLLEKMTERFHGIRTQVCSFADFPVLPLSPLPVGTLQLDHLLQRQSAIFAPFSNLPR